MVNYQETVMYQITCNKNNVTDVYVGHCTKFKRRQNEHKYACTNVNAKSYNVKVYDFIRNNGNWENWTMSEIEKFPCQSRVEASVRERYWTETLKATLNDQIPNRSSNEADTIRRKQNPDRYKQYAKQSYKKRAEQINLKRKLKFKCCCGKTCRKSDKKRHYQSFTHISWREQELEILKKMHLNLQEIFNKSNKLFLLNVH
jgi:hypothetical protein